MKQYTVTGMSCAASASAASASPRACCTRSNPCTPTRSAPSCKRMISQDCIPPLPAVCSRLKRSAIPPSARPHRVYGVWSGIRTSQRRQNQKMNCRKMKRAPKREFRCSFVIILCDTHCLEKEMGAHCAPLRQKKSSAVPLFEAVAGLRSAPD